MIAFRFPVSGMPVRKVQDAPLFDEVSTVPLEPTATKVPPPKATPFRTWVVGVARSVQVTPSGDVITFPEKPTATYRLGVPKVTAFNDCAPWTGGICRVQVVPFGEVSTAAPLPLVQQSPTATNWLPPKTTPRRF